MLYCFIMCRIKIKFSYLIYLILYTGSGFQWYRTYDRAYETSGSSLRFMLRRSSLVECVSVLYGTCLQSVDFFCSSVYMQPCLSKNFKYTFYTIKSSLTLAYQCILHKFHFFKSPKTFRVIITIMFASHKLFTARFKTKMAKG